MLTIILIYLIGCAITYVVSRVRGDGIALSIKFALIWPKWLVVLIGLLVFAWSRGRR